MNDLNKDLESLVGDMGMSISDEAPVVAPETEQSTEQPEEDSVETVQDEPQPEVEPAQEQQEVVEEQPESSLQEEEISEEELESTMLQYLSERLGREVSSFDQIGGTQDTSVEID